MTTNQGRLYVVAAPSGTGKTSLVKALVESVPELTVSISHTTRQKRPGEVEGTNYHFVDKATFEEMIKHNDFLEHAVIFDNDYGTSKKWVTETLASGMDVILEIDWQGHQQIKHLLPDAVSIFILPPSFKELTERLTKRNQDLPDIIKQRLADAAETVSHLDEFDYLVVNDDFNHALHDLTTIVRAGHLMRERQVPKYTTLIKHLAKAGT